MKMIFTSFCLFLSISSVAVAGTEAITCTGRSLHSGPTDRHCGTYDVHKLNFIVNESGQLSGEFSHQFRSAGCYMSMVQELGSFDARESSATLSLDLVAFNSPYSDHGKVLVDRLTRSVLLVLPNGISIPMECTGDL